jgi:cation transport regulator ChaC
MLARRHRPHFVFGYGSLVGLRDGARAASIEGLRRVWDVAMNNALDLPGYKYFLDEATRERPEIFVAFLNLRPTAGAVTNGVLLPVAARDVEALDGRERNYRRIDVSDRITGAPPRARVWTYVGTEDARERFGTGVRRGVAAIQRRYLDGVLADFRALGERSLRAFHRSTDPAPCPVRDLARIDLP